MKKLISVLFFILLLTSCAPLTKVNSTPFNDVYYNVHSIQFDQYGWSWKGTLK